MREQVGIDPEFIGVARLYDIDLVFFDCKRILEYSNTINKQDG